MLQILSHLDSNNLFTVSIITSTVADFYDWGKVDRALADPRFSNLREFSVQTSLPSVRADLVAQLCLFMHSSHAREILRVKMGC